ncbi:MAG TPA: SDR family NAD(P)-dependent oxidoreductase, partial [Cytophagales bacterium]|nr:SDR family NAD(P)-dependent oxidoreductase [Cytophagales bacterium]
MNDTKYALITGGSRGIGKALAAQLASRGYHLLLVAGTEHLLHDTAETLQSLHPHIKIKYLAIDLSSDTAAQAVFDWSTPFHHQIHILANNAGVGINGHFTEKLLGQQLSVIDVNFRTLVALSYLFVPILKSQKKAYLLNVASTAAYQSVPYLTIYAASKAAVLSFSRGLKHELRNSSVSVSCLSPGSTDTNFADRAEMSAALKKLAQKFNMSPEKVAAVAVEGL